MISRKMLEEMGRRCPRVGTTLKIRFCPESITSLHIMILHQDLMGVRFLNLSLVAMICQSRDWGGDGNRTIEVESSEIFFNKIFAERILPNIESIEFASDHPLKAIATKRAKTKTESVARIIGECCDPIKADLADYGLTITGEYEEVNELPQLVFYLKNGEKVEGNIVLDGWSGQMIVNGNPTGMMYNRPEQFHAAVWAMVEKMTA